MAQSRKGLGFIFIQMENIKEQHANAMEMVESIRGILDDKNNINKKDAIAAAIDDLECYIDDMLSEAEYFEDQKNEESDERVENLRAEITYVIDNG